MDINLLVKGFTVGFVVAIPLGPVGLLCTQRTLVSGRMHGLVSGLGAATSDVIYASVAVFGLTMVSNFLIEQQMWFRLFGGILICLLGLRVFMAKRAKTGPFAEKLSHFNNYISTLLLTLSNPMSILVSGAMFAGLGLFGSGAQGGRALLAIGGVFLGSMFWWVTLSTTVGAFHRKVDNGTMVLLSRIFGGILTAIGIAVIIIAIV